MSLTAPVVWVSALVLAIGLPTLALWWVLVRTPRTPGQFVSTAWRDEHIRERRD